MPFNFPDALNSIGASVLEDGSETYTPEMMFLIGAVNRLTCMGGPNYNPGTQKLLNSVFDQEGPKKAVELLFLIHKVAYSRLTENIDYRFFWNLFKSCHEDLSEFKQQLGAYSSEEENWSKFIPESIKKEFS